MIAYTLWFTGLSGSGKSTIANKLKEELNKRAIQVVLLDGDVVRKYISYDVGYTKEDRDTHIKRVVGASHITNMNGIMAIACVISPTKTIRTYARSLIKNFIEVYVECPISICKSRDVKGLYKQVDDGSITEFVGITVPYDIPETPDIVVKTNEETIDESVSKIIKYLEDKKILKVIHDNKKKDGE